MIVLISVIIILAANCAALVVLAESEDKSKNDMEKAKYIALLGIVTVMVILGIYYNPDDFIGFLAAFAGSVTAGFAVTTTALCFSILLAEKIDKRKRHRNGGYDID